MVDVWCDVTSSPNAHLRCVSDRGVDDVGTIDVTRRLVSKEDACEGLFVKNGRRMRWRAPRTGRSDNGVQTSGGVVSQA